MRWKFAPGANFTSTVSPAPAPPEVATAFDGAALYSPAVFSATAVTTPALTAVTWKVAAWMAVPPVAVTMSPTL